MLLKVFRELNNLLFLWLTRKCAFSFFLRWKTMKRLLVEAVRDFNPPKTTYTPTPTLGIPSQRGLPLRPNLRSYVNGFRFFFSSRSWRFPLFPVVQCYCFKTVMERRPYNFRLSLHFRWIKKTCSATSVQ